MLPKSESRGVAHRVDPISKHASQKRGAMRLENIARVLPYCLARVHPPFFVVFRTNEQENDPGVVC